MSFEGLGRGWAAWMVVGAALGCGQEFTGTDAFDASVDGSAGTQGGSGGAGGSSTSDGGAGGSGGLGAGGSGTAGSGVAGAAGSTGGTAGAAGGGAGRAGASGAGGAGGRGGSAGAGGGGASGGSVDAGPDAAPLGSSCMSGLQCATGNCVDGRCCENACSTPCMACNLPNSIGLCRAISSGPDTNASAPCSGAKTCCNGTCSDTTSVTSCGASCVNCVVTSDRQVPTCNGTQCGVACKNDDPKCSDGTCSRLAWNFDSGSLDGIAFRSSSGSPLAVRSFNGNNALAVDVAQLNTLSEVSFTMPICLSGNVDLSTRTFSFRVYFDGGPATMYDYWFQASVPVPQGGAYLDQGGGGTGTWMNYSSPMSKSSFSSATTAITIQVGSLGGPFTGTIWFDDIKVQ